LKKSIEVLPEFPYEYQRNRRTSSQTNEETRRIHQPVQNSEQAEEQEVGEYRFHSHGGENHGRQELRGRWTCRYSDFRQPRPAGG